ncbi:MAG TPA: DinB family protein [Chitinophagaceae bacterium]|nr:DinB family protein [Chitinophagaceae bacterium]
MNRKTEWVRMFQYEAWANNLTLESIRTAQGAEHRTLQIFSHVLSAPLIWLDRLENRPPSTELWAARTVEECAAAIQAGTEGWTRFIENSQDAFWDEYFTFSLFGQPKRILLADVPVHLFHHASYHRGQIILQLKGKLPELPLTTYIAYAAAD